MLPSCNKKDAKYELTLFLTNNDINKLKKSIDPSHFQFNHFANLKHYTDSIINLKVNVPDRGGNWYHYYADPVEGRRMITGKQIGPFQWEHYNFDSSQVYLGNPDIPSEDYNGVVISTQIHGFYSNALFASALMHQLTNEKKYLDYCNDVMNHYIIQYPKYPYRNIHHQPDFDKGTGVGKVSVQSLDESVWLIRILQGLDLIWDDLEAERRQSIEDNILMPAMSAITRNRRGVHNIQCWNNAAIGLTGYLIGNDSLVNLAVNDPEHGFNTNLDNGLTSDGLWYERSPSYHFYAIEPIHILAEAVKNHGAQGRSLTIKKLFDAPLRFSPPNGDMPRLNDARPIYLPNFKRLYFYAYSRFKDPEYKKILESVGSNENLIFNYEWFYSDEQYDEKPLLLESNTASYAGTWIDILYRKNFWTLVQYDKNAGGHAHPDALSFVTWYNGDYTAIDPGIADYGAPAYHNWYKNSLSHNTLIINGENQAFNGGELLNSGIEKGIPFTQLKANELYDGVVFYRTLCLPDESTILISDVVKSDVPKEMELAYHTRGSFKNDPDGPDYELKEGYPYSFIKNPKGVSSGFTFNVDIEGPGLNSGQRISMYSNRRMELVYGIGPGFEFEDTPMILLKHSSNEWRVTWLISYGSNENRMETDHHRIELINDGDQSTILSFIIDPEKGLFEVL